MFGGMSKNFWGVWVCFFMDLKVASKNCTRLPYFTLLECYVGMNELEPFFKKNISGNIFKKIKDKRMCKKWKNS